MIEIKAITINGQLMPKGIEPIILLNQADLDSYRFELWADICHQKGVDFSKEDAHTSILITYKATR